MKTLKLNYRKTGIALLSASILLGFVSCNSETESESIREEVSMTNNSGLNLQTMAFNAREKGGEKSEAQKKIEREQKAIANAEHELVGYWVGPFGETKDGVIANKINIAIGEVKDGKISGHTICAGNFRPFKGTIESPEEGIYTLEFEEPGDNKYDGVFSVVIGEDKNGNMAGSWSPFKNTTKAKEFELAKTTFTYDPTLGEYPEGSTRLLTVEDVENINPTDLELMRNEIYARHGYSFKNKTMRKYFDEKDWYVPMGVDIREQLSDNEVKNIDLIYRYEEYFEEYYDEFGR